MKDSFLNMVSHDLRTPMTAIKAYTSIMRENIGKLNQQSQEKYLDIIIKQGDRLTRLINNLLDIQRFEAGKMEMDFELLDMREIAIESVDAFMALAQEKNIKLEKSIPSNRIIISGHRDRLSQVMSNLLSNAVKFTPENGRIMVSVKIITEDDKGAARVTVSDNGPGIPVDKQDRLFQKFHQVHEEERHKEQGTGLGLALVRQIVEYHNGRVGVTSEPGKGSNFYFLLPLEEQ
jgi:signal transduction histidine kinase